MKVLKKTDTYGIYHLFSDETFVGIGRITTIELHNNIFKLIKGFYCLSPATSERGEAIPGGAKFTLLLSVFLPHNILLAKLYQ